MTSNLNALAAAERSSQGATRDDMQAASSAHAALSLKITDPEVFRYAVDRHSIVLTNSPAAVSVYMPYLFRMEDKYWSEARLSRQYDETWWLNREIAREVFGVYPSCTSTLDEVRSRSGLCGAMFPHVSKNDPTMIAYTPDRQSGLADRQVTTTFGRFLRKFLPLLTDEAVQYLEAQHRSELDPNFLVAETQEDVERVYTRMSGDSGCMRYPRSQFNLKNYHPSAIYAAPQFGLRVAYLTDPDGEIKSRCVIYDNPENPADKRFVRIYGDSVLRRKLMRAGYQLSSLGGVKVPALRDDPEGDPRRYVMPYIDPADGNNAGNNTGKVFGTLHIKGTDYIELVGEERYNELRYETEFGPSRDTSGRVAIPTHDAGALDVTCLFSGEPFRRHRNAIRWINEAGELGYASPNWVRKTIAEGVLTSSIYTIDEGGDRINTECTDATRRALCYTNQIYYHRSEAVLRNRNWVQLDATLYPDNQLEAYARNDKSIVVLGSITAIKREHAIQIHSANGEELVHESAFTAQMRKTLVATPKREGVRVYATKDCPKLVKSPSGRHALIGVHSLVKLDSGIWEFARNTAAYTVFGRTQHHAIGEGYKTTNEQLTEAVMIYPTAYLRDGAIVSARADLLKSLRRGCAGYSAFSLSDGQLVTVGNNTYNAVPSNVETVLAAAQHILANKDSDEFMATVAYGEAHVRAVLGWATGVVHMVDAFRKMHLDFIGRRVQKAWIGAIVTCVVDEVVTQALDAEITPVTRDEMAFAGAA